jgi:two-component system chemotaxis sensor kinase CheA
MSNTHALIIDDDLRNLNVLAEMLEMEGVRYTKIQDTLEIEDTLQNVGSVDIVFLDLEMPGRDGYEVFEVISSLPTYQNVPVVAYTVHVTEINTAKQLGFHSFLAKPLDSDRFPKQLAQILNGEPVWVVK